MSIATILSRTNLIGRFGRDLHAVRWRCTAVEKAKQLEVGAKLHGYTIDKVVPVPELYLTAVKLTHDKTGAEHMHIARDDSDNVFGVAFRTTPMDDTGVPHILEHTTLCGSQKFPVRDPFFKMLNRSLSTFMNAFTSTDWTMYPFSTQNTQDYQNLLSVYLDAVFFPRLRETDFSQEGWRLEHEEPLCQNSPIIFKGVVFNEMKGVFSNSQQLFSQKTQNLLLPSHTYSTCFGGDPAHIPELTWDQLKHFHASHYHPSNSRFYTYGSLPLEKHLEQINADALSKFAKIDPKTDVPLEPRWTSPREARIECQPDPMVADQNKQTTIAVNFLLSDVSDPFEAYTLSLISSLLVNGEKSPFYRGLLEANIGSDYSPETGHSTNTRDSKFSVGLIGIAEGDVERVKQIISETIDSVIEEGFEKEQIEAKLHEVELSQKHQSSMFGLHMGVGLIPHWNHGGDPTEFVQMNKYLDQVKQCLKDNPRFFQEKVKQYWKDNNHRLTLVMSPSDDFEQKRQEQEAHMLQGMLDNVTADDKTKIYEKGIELLEIQSAEEDLSCLPTLRVSDIDLTKKTTPINVFQSNGVLIQSCEQPTNGVTYFRAMSSVSDLPEDLKPYLPLFCDIVTSMGAGAMDYKELSQQIELKTGGLDADTHVTGHHSDPNLFEQSVVFSSHCLDRNIGSMFDLWREIFLRLDMSDIQRLTMLIRMTASVLANSITDKGHMYAMSHAASSLSPSAHVDELFSGMTQVSLMKTIAEMSDLGHVIQSLKDISHHVLNRHRLRCAVNATPHSMEHALEHTQSFVKDLYYPDAHKMPASLTQKDFYREESTFRPHSVETHFELPFQVNYVSKSVRTVPLTHPDFAKLNILGRLMTTKFLHREIREKGGAYGGGAMASHPGQFNFYSYRDPNSDKTLDAFESAITWARDGNFTLQDIDESKLGVFQKVDMPVTPANKGMRLFSHDITDNIRHTYKQHLINVTKDDLIYVTNKYLSPDSTQSSVSLLGPENPLSKDNKDWQIKHSS